MLLGGGLVFAEYHRGTWVDEQLFVDEHGDIVSEEPDSKYEKAILTTAEELSKNAYLIKDSNKIKLLNNEITNL